MLRPDITRITDDATAGHAHSQHATNCLSVLHVLFAHSAHEAARVRESELTTNSHAKRLSPVCMMYVPASDDAVCHKHPHMQPAGPAPAPPPAAVRGSCAAARRDTDE